MIISSKSNTIVGNVIALVILTYCLSGCAYFTPRDAVVVNVESPELIEAKLCGHGSVSPEERALLRRLLETRLASISFCPPATFEDAVEFFRRASAPVGRRETEIDIRIEAVTENYKTNPISEFSADDIPLYEAIKLVADLSGFRIEIRGKQVILKECAGCRLSIMKFSGYSGLCLK